MTLAMVKARLARVVILCALLVVMITITMFAADRSHQPDMAAITLYDVNQLTERLSRHVWVLAEEIGERHVENPGSLQQAADYIEAEFNRAGLPPQRQVYDRDYRNIVAEIKGTVSPDEIILIGAHYDTVWLSPGADDNASGVAVLLELARMLVSRRFEKSMRFVAFTNEEQPFAESAAMGSRVYAERSRHHGENIIAMYSLEMLGFYADEPGSQQYPSALLSWIYPDTASFIAFVANPLSGMLLGRSLRSFRRHSDFPVQGLMAPERLVPDIRRSDHASFWDAGYPALMITDTASYRNINYHTVGDVPRTLDYLKMADLAGSLGLMFANLARPVAD